MKNLTAEFLREVAYDLEFGKIDHDEAVRLVSECIEPAAGKGFTSFKVPKWTHTHAKALAISSGSTVHRLTLIADLKETDPYGYIVVNGNLSPVFNGAGGIRFSGNSGFSLIASRIGSEFWITHISQ